MKGSKADFQELIAKVQFHQKPVSLYHNNLQVNEWFANNGGSDISALEKTPNS